MCIRKCNTTALIFEKALNVGAELNLNGISMLSQYPHSERKIVIEKDSILNIGNLFV